MSELLKIKKKTFGRKMTGKEFENLILPSLGKQGERQDTKTLEKKIKQFRQEEGIHSENQKLNEDQLARITKKIIADQEIKGFVSPTKTQKLKKQLLEKEVSPENTPNKPSTPSRGGFFSRILGGKPRQPKSNSQQYNSLNTLSRGTKANLPSQSAPTTLNSNLQKPTIIPPKN